MTLAAADERIDRGTERAFAQRVLATYVFVGGGSGVVVSPDGLVLTNHHVVDDLEDFTVRFANGTSYPSTLLGMDSVGDIALLRIKRPTDDLKFPFAEFSSVEAMRVGAEVFAVGNPFGLGDLDDTSPRTGSATASTSIAFPGDFVFQLTVQEASDLRFQNGSGPGLRQANV